MKTPKGRAQSMRKTWPTLPAAWVMVETSFLVMATISCPTPSASTCGLEKWVSWPGSVGWVWGHYLFHFLNFHSSFSISISMVVANDTYLSTHPASPCPSIRPSVLPCKNFKVRHHLQSSEHIQPYLPCLWALLAVTVLCHFQWCDLSLGVKVSRKQTIFVIHMSSIWIYIVSGVCTVSWHLFNFHTVPNRAVQNSMWLWSRAVWTVLCYFNGEKMVRCCLCH